MFRGGYTESLTLQNRCWVNAAGGVLPCGEIAEFGCLFYVCIASVFCLYFIGTPKVNENGRDRYAKVKGVNKGFRNGGIGALMVNVSGSKR